MKRPHPEGYNIADFTAPPKKEQKVELLDLKKEKREKNKLRHCILQVSYIGTNYSGIQVNPGVASIEQTILNALHSANLIDSNNHKTCCVGRACRTDKGVHAAKNVISMKIRQKEVRLKQQFLSMVNQQLAKARNNDILITNVMRVQPNFNAQKNCSSREYLYILPLSLIDTSKPFKNTLINTQGTIMYNSLDELLTRFNQLLAKYVGRHAFHNYTERIDAGTDESYRHLKQVTTVKLPLPSIESQKVFLEKQSQVAPPEPNQKCGVGLSKLLEILPLKMEYIGDTDIFQVRSDNPDHDLRFVCIKLHGNSFMMHQIRKMITMAIAVTRGICDESVMDKSLLESYLVPILEAPGSGLFLDKMDYETYNGSRGDMEPLVWDEDNMKVCEEWKTHVIIPEIIRHEMEMPSSRWLCELMLTKSKYFSVQPSKAKAKK